MATIQSDATAVRGGIGRGSTIHLLKENHERKS